MYVAITLKNKYVSKFFTYMATLLTHNSVGQLANKDAVDEIHPYTFLPICCGKTQDNSGS